MRLGDLDALKEEVKGMFCPDGYKLDFIRKIDNAPTVDKVINIYPKGDVIIQEKRPQGERNPILCLVEKYI